MKGKPGMTAPGTGKTVTRVDLCEAVYQKTAARKFAKEYFERYPKDRYQTEVESWRPLQSFNIEFTMKRLREPIEG
jgi:hypothetical protein